MAKFAKFTNLAVLVSQLFVSQWSVGEAIQPVNAKYGLTCQIRIAVSWHDDKSNQTILVDGVFPITAVETSVTWQIFSIFW